MLANNIEQIIQTDNLDTVTNVGMITLDSSKTGFTMKVLNRLWDLEWQPIQERLDSLDLDSILENRLQQAGIDLNYVYAVSSEMADSLVYGNREYADELLTSEFRTRLFPHDILVPRDYLVLFFPESEAYLWKQMTPMLFSMILFLMIIISCFIYTVKTIIDQKRNAALMIDFVNNMTHEFKTPISTVALACEAILRSDVISDNTKVEQYSRLIRDENRRMRSQTEKILQMATLEEGDLEFKTEAVDLHAVIHEAMDNIALQIENRGGVIAASLQANDYFVPADKIHLENIIFNLLDNANKYSGERPDIMISTWNDKEQVFMQVEDHGKGISEENLKHIFKKYYRVPTGNIHDVKGFGLGLSYVKLMVEAHNGGISIKSKLGKGTRVVLFLPVLKARRVKSGN
jgi:two-component system phosphate regulon sensor histidine kinase PhoR